MSAPNRYDAVLKVRDSHPHLFRLNTNEATAEIVQRFCGYANEGDPQKPWGLTKKDKPENGHYPPGSSTGFSHDAATWLPGADPNQMRERWQYDIVNGAGGGTVSPDNPVAKPGSPAWTEVPQHVYRPSNIWLRADTFPALNVSGDVPQTRCDLYLHWFPFMRSQAEFAEHAENFAWLIAPEHKPKGLRIFGDVEGQAHLHPVTREDPWAEAGIDWRDTRWRDWFRRTRDTFIANDLKMILTLHGGRFHFHGWDDRRRYYDMVRQELAGFERVVRYLEGMNEFGVNRWAISEVQQTGLYLRQIFGDTVDIALSSPESPHTLPEDATNEEMAAGFHALYGHPGGSHFGASVCGVHIMRVDSRWGDPASYNPFSDLPMTSNEHRAPGSYLSVRDVGRLRNDAYMTRNAGWPVMCPVPGVGVFNGHISPTFGHRVKLFKDEDGLEQAMLAWKDVLERNGETSVPVPVPKPPVEPPTFALLPGQSLLPGQVLRAGEYGFTIHPDGNQVTYGPVPGRGHWESHTAGSFDVVNLQMQHDGFLILRGAPPAPGEDGRVIWGISGPPGSHMQLQADDGNWVMYHEGTPVWASADHP